MEKKGWMAAMDGGSCYHAETEDGRKRIPALHSKIQRGIRKFSFLKNRGAGISSAVADNNIIRKGII